MRRVSEASGVPSTSASVATGTSPPPSFPVRPGFTARLRQHSYGGSSSGLHGLHGHGGSSSGTRLCMQLAAILGCLLLGFQISRQASLAVVGQKERSKKIGVDVDRSEELDKQGSGTNARFNTRFNLFGLSDWLESSTEFSQVLRAQELAAMAAGRPWKSGKRRMTLVVTPTFARTFQAMYLGGLGASLRLVPGPLLWIVVEAGGKTAETEAILVGSGVRFKHLASGDRQPNPLDWSERSEMEVRLRIRALLHIRRARLDGVVLFCDESNVHSLTFFEEAQNVHWFGAAPVGFLVQDGYVDSFASEMMGGVPKNRRRAKQRSHFKRLPLQAPVCARNSTRIVGWHVFPHRPSDLDSMGPPIRDTEEASSLEWGGFVLNARLLWDEDLVAKRPGWVRAWQQWSGEIVGEEDLLGEWQSAGGADILTRMLRDDGHVEPLGRCGWRTLLWWTHAEARFSSLYPPMWNLGENPLPPEADSVQETLNGEEDGEGRGVAEETAREGEAATGPRKGDGSENPHQGLIPQNRRFMARLDVLGDRLSVSSSTTKMAGESELVMELEEDSFITAAGETEELELSEERRRRR